MCQEFSAPTLATLSGDDFAAAHADATVITVVPFGGGWQRAIAEAIGEANATHWLKHLMALDTAAAGLLAYFDGDLLPFTRQINATRTAEVVTVYADAEHFAAGMAEVAKSYSPSREEINAKLVRILDDIAVTTPSRDPRELPERWDGLS